MTAGGGGGGGGHLAVWSGRPFHRRGAAEQKARSPMVRSLVLGTRRSELLVDLRVRVEVWGVMSSCRPGLEESTLSPEGRRLRVRAKQQITQTEAARLSVVQ
ncbi:unnamed protein product [Pleuronectes platessa]|uniref:Uncharacterized protein n=1 Tax=Pleuronectes platessa TaxID=8262 RepID=A0A9N7USF1_PLEPL|nr:unnamed protein product [Pleuronectes platessa]